MTYAWLGIKVSHQFIIFWLSLAALLHNVLMNGANNVIISSLQKEFYLSSRETGVYVSIYDMGSLISAVVIPFASAQGSKPRWIAFGMVMLFTGCFTNVLPHFLRTNSVNSFNNENSIELCNQTLINGVSLERPHPSAFEFETSTKSDHNNQHQNNKIFQLKHLLYAANIINGLSSASMTSLAFSYIEDIAPPGLSSIYESIYFAVGALGVGIGFIITSKCLSIHTDFNRPNNVLPDWLTESHPNWIGAWWLPFLVFGFVALLLAIVIFIFPKRLKDKNELGEERNDTVKMKLTTTNGHVNSLNSNEAIKINDDLKEDSTESVSTPATNPDDEDDVEEIEEAVNDSFLQNEIKIPKQKSDQHNHTILNTLDQAGSIISINKAGFYASQDKIDENINNNNNNKKKYEKTKNNLKDLIKKSIFLFKNPVYVFVIIATTIEGLLQNSFLAFAPLFLEYQYRLPSGTSSLIIGLLSIPPLIIGGLLSGIIVKKLKNETISCFKFLSIVLFLNIFVYAGFLLFCQEPTLISYENQLDLSNNLNNNTQLQCFNSAQNCNCDSKIFKPVCLSNSKNIFFQSPCLAGCTSYIQQDKSEDFYSNCSQSKCNDYYDLTSLQKEHTFKDGLCPNKSCHLKLVMSYICIFLLMLLNAITFLPYLKVTIGCVNSKEMNTIVLGLKQFFMNAFGTIPGPILFGTVIDATCSYWHTDSHDQSVCKVYNNRKFALGFGLLGIGFKAVCFFLIILSLIFSIRSSKKRNIK